MRDPPTHLLDALRDRYQIEYELGQGGMATVYLARDLRYDRPVAFKLLRPELAAILGHDRFLREIRVTATLQHPHILPLLDSGSVGPQLYYVMPYVEGQSLRERLVQEGQLPLEEALRIARGLGFALDYAHERGVIHRDIKPENILLFQDEPMVADFGIALAASSAGQDRLTETGLSLGTPAYMSPEQASADPRLDGRTDQYSVACVVYEMLAGEPPYTGPTAQAIIAKRLSEPIPHLGTLRQVPAGVEAAVTRALAKAPADRFPRMADFIQALDRPARMPRQRLARRALVSLAGISLLVFLGVLAVGLQPTSKPGAMVMRQLTFTGNACCPAVSPDGRWAAFDRNDSLMVQELSGSRPLFVAHEKLPGDGPRWSPDGAHILYSGPDYRAKDSEDLWLYTVPRLGGEPRQIANAGWAWYSYGLDGRHVVFSDGLTDSIFIADVESQEVVGRFSVAPQSYMTWRVRYSPNGRWIAFGGAREGIPFLAIVSPDGSTMHRLVDWVDRGTVEWSPRGDALYFFQRVPGGADLMKVRIHPETGERQGQPERVMSHAPFYEFSIAADGKTLLFQKDTDARHIWAMTITPLTGRAVIQAKQLTSGTAIFGNPAISPDGRWVVYAQDEGQERNLYVVPFEGGNPRLIGPTITDRMAPRWAADNRRLAFASADSSARGVMIANLRESRVTRHGHSPPRLFMGSLAWSPDNRKLLFPPDDPSRFVMLDIATDRETEFAPPTRLGALHSPHFSPDGSKVILTSSNGRTQSHWLVDVPTKQWKPLDGDQWRGIPLLWSRDNWIYLLRDKEIWRLRSGGGTAHLYASLPRKCMWWEQPSLDDRARRLVCTVSEYKSDIWVATNFDPAS